MPNRADRFPFPSERKWHSANKCPRWAFESLTESLLQQGRIPIVLPSLQLSGTVKHASMTNSSGDAVFTVCQLAGFSPRHCHTLTSPHSDWVELIQLPSSVTFARLTWHRAGSTSNQLAFARPGSCSRQEWNRTKQHRTGSKAEGRANLSHLSLSRLGMSTADHTGSTCADFRSKVLPSALINIPPLI